MSPKVFISYSWTSASHQQWVLDLATQLRESGVDVIIDKWDLKEGHDSVAFMEKMVTDSTIQKVIVVLDQGYAEKADGRKGGVGTESQIISPEVYAKTDQSKFVGVISELGADGKPYLPVFYKSRIYIDLSSADAYAQSFDQLLRWIYGKPAFPKPPLGKTPEFLDEVTVLIPTRTRARRTIDLLRSGAVGSVGSFDEYLSALSDNFENLRITRSNDKIFDDQVVESIAAFLPYRDEFIEVISAVARFSRNDDNLRSLRRLFERLAPLLDRQKDVRQWYREDFDNFKFLIHELFLYTTTVFIKHERYETVSELLEDYFAGNMPDFCNDPMQSYAIFRSDLDSLAQRNQRLNLNRASLAGELIAQRAATSGVVLRDLMQADFVLFLRDAVLAIRENRRQKWWPDSLVWYGEHSGPFEIFARAESKRYFERIKPMLSAITADEIRDLVLYFGVQNSRLFLPNWGHWSAMPVARAGNFEKLGQKP